MSIINKKIGIIGGGQLGKMMILEAKRLGFYVAVLDPAADCPANSICDEQVVSGFNNAEGYFELARKVGKTGVITYEFEHINADALEILEKEGYIIYPSVKSLKTIQNKFTQKTVLKQNHIPVPRFAQIASDGSPKIASDGSSKIASDGSPKIASGGSPVEQIRELGKTENFGFPIMLKAATGGYDGKGNALIRNESEIESAFNQLGGGAVELMAEEFVDFEMETSVIACRGIDGKKAVVYRVGENIHANSILDMTIVPARISDDMINNAEKTAAAVMDVFDGVGTFCVELFVTKSGEIYVNEVAPRPHNSGHYTIEGCFASQFENHIRAITGLPLGSASLIQPTVMVNLLGESDGAAQLGGLEETYLDSKVKVHFYGKSESKAGRKMGHFTVVGENLEEALKRAEKLKKIVRVVGY